MSWSPQLTGIKDGPVIRLGHPLIDAYLELVAARARANTLLAQAFDLKVFFSFVSKDPSDVTATDVLAFINAQRQPQRGTKVVRIDDGEVGLAARTIKRRLASIASLYEYLLIRGDSNIAHNPFLGAWRCAGRASEPCGVCHSSEHPARFLG